MEKALPLANPLRRTLLSCRKSRRFSVRLRWRVIVLFAQSPSRRSVYRNWEVFSMVAHQSLSIFGKSCWILRKEPRECRHLKIWWRSIGQAIGISKCTGKDHGISLILGFSTMKDRRGFWRVLVRICRWSAERQPIPWTMDGHYLRYGDLARKADQT